MQVGDKFKAEGLCKLREEILNLSEKFTSVYDNNVEDAENEYIKPLSITLGINLDKDLCPMEATVVSLNEKKYTRAPFLNRLISGNRDEFESIYEFHPNEENKLSSKIISDIEEASGSLVKVDSTALQLNLISDLDRIIKNTISPLRLIIHRYTHTYSRFFINLKYELLFFRGVVDIIKKVQAFGMPMCRAKVEAKEKKVCSIEGFYNVNLALQVTGKTNKIVENTLDFNKDENIYILTGPNSGGKTTYINAISLIQVLFQAGIYVPAQNACISPVDNVYTHFSSEEKRDTDYGRLGEEAKRLNEIFKQATNYSLIILNESLASTSPGECLYMSKDILYGLKLLDAHAIFATHQHELAANMEELNEKHFGNGKISSLVAGSEKQKNSTGEESFKRTYKVIKAHPEGISYAKDIAESFGISYEQIARIISERYLDVKNR